MEDNLKWVARVLSGMIEARDPHVRDHVEGVAQLARSIGKEMGLSEMALGNLWLAGIVHDVGKIGVPPEILNKVGPLDKYEREFVESHVQLSLKIIQESSLPTEIVDLVAQHHERLDGRGYPRRMKGDQIVLGARILAVADVFNAMSSDRPYRTALPEKAARLHLVEHSGILYDPAVLEAFFKVLKQFNGE